MGTIGNHFTRRKPSALIASLPGEGDQPCQTKARGRIENGPKPTRARRFESMILEGPVRRKMMLQLSVSLVFESHFIGNKQKNQEKYDIIIQFSLCFASCPICSALS
jgi:hypothetical protein